LFSNILCLRSCLYVRGQVSHHTTGKIIALHILIFKFVDSNREGRRFWTEWQQALLEFNLLLISSWIKFAYVNIFLYTQALHVRTRGREHTHTHWHTCMRNTKCFRENSSTDKVDWANMRSHTESLLIWNTYSSRC
jgi:hypothetical protein